MEDKRTNILTVRPDPITGKCPTWKQAEVLLLLNPHRYPGTKYKEVAKLLGISPHSVKQRMDTLKSRCPDIARKFRLERFKKREVKHRFKVGCLGCGCELPTGQERCFVCWRDRDKKKYPSTYKKDPMFPANGKTKNTAEWDKWSDNDDWDASTPYNSY